MRVSAFLLCIWLAAVPTVLSLTSYANDFIDPSYVVSKSFNSTTAEAQESIVEWAIQLAEFGPWSVLNKSVIAPSGDKHDYMSWAPYSWPNCTGVGNTTALTDEEIWKTCPYYTRDGLFNPDVRFVNDVGAFQNMSDAVLYNALAWAINGSSTFSTNVATYIKTWFLDDDTMMNPNLNYAQMERGPTGQNGTHTGVLDLKCMSKLVSGILILREGNAAEWTSDLDSSLVSWTKEYITWLTTADIAIQEKEATNNHGTFYYNQLAALQILANDTSGALATIKEYFTTQYQNQIWANGEQPLEMIRTRPYHYRSYNLAAMITNARLGSYLGYDAWTLETKNGSTIQTALDFALTVDPGSETASELYPDVAAVGSTYGDSDGKYAAWLAAADDTYPQQPYFFWDQNFSDSGLSKNVTAASTPTSTKHDNAAQSIRSGLGDSVAGLCIAVLAMLL
ncbi:chondroitin AC/alginate lyase [Punctularia strigosozonata HHB-11173 SS5]|uniref:chondroitin AC/alginate lyase n=1 Tax=Punctularia strigosozonata (strain HHB-11173) TaxID=741275 RepID=UPI0004418135|nr:chondroitin AC/alginate lyase [Punctularia strigosozonata HHB-11173 SS5]EIN14695.1 chondroitin AC/alginate lyase [Punctularia strigosozonata HHB-11173 SS5]